MKIYDIEDLDQDPETGIYVDTTCFSTDIDLSVIHHYYEGMAYIMRDKATNEIFGQGIIDGSPFEECEEHEGLEWGTWQWHRDDELRKLKLIPLPKISDLKIKPKKGCDDKYVVTACVENRIMSIVYHFKPRIKKATEDLIDKYLKDKEVNPW